MSTFIALSLSMYVILLVLATYLTRSVPPSSLPILLILASILSVVLLQKPKLSETLSRFRSELTSRRWMVTGLTTLLPLLVFLPALLALLFSTRMQISTHGFFHSAYVFQILHGFIPPENVTLPGYPVNNYWPYHALLAVLTQLLNDPPPLASTWLNIVTLLASLALSFQLIRRLVGQTGALRGTFLGMVGLFGMNLFGAFHTWINGDSDYLRPAVIMGDYRVAHMLDKFLNYTGFSPGIMLYLFALVILAGMVKKRCLSRYDFLWLTIATLGAMLFHATTGLYMAAVLPVALAGTYAIHLRKRGPGNALQTLWKDARASVAHLRSPGNAITVLLSGAVAVPVLHSVYRTSLALPVKSQIDWFSLYDTQSILGAIYPAIPLILPGMIWAWRKNSLEVLLLGFIYMLGCGLALVTALPDGNDYKFIVLANIAAYFAAAFALAELSRKKKLRILEYAVIALVCANILMVGAHRLSMPWFSERIFRYQGVHVVAAVEKHEEYRDLRYADLFLWARESTPVNTVIIVPRLYKDRSSLFLLSERVPYYVDADIFNRSEAKRVRTKLIDDLYKNSVNAAEKLAIIQSIREDLPERPFFLVYPHDVELPPEIPDLVDPEDVIAGQLATGFYLPALEAQAALK